MSRVCNFCSEGTDVYDIGSGTLSHRHSSLLHVCGGVVLLLILLAHLPLDPLHEFVDGFLFLKERQWERGEGPGGTF